MRSVCQSRRKLLQPSGPLRSSRRGLTRRGHGVEDRAGPVELMTTISKVCPARPWRGFHVAERTANEGFSSLPRVWPVQGLMGSLEDTKGFAAVKRQVKALASKGAAPSAPTSKVVEER